MAPFTIARGAVGEAPAGFDLYPPSAPHSVPLGDKVLATGSARIEGGSTIPGIRLLGSVGIAVIMSELEPVGMSNEHPGPRTVVIDMQRKPQFTFATLPEVNNERGSRINLGIASRSLEQLSRRR
jgi:hypothetical protein